MLKKETKDEDHEFPMQIPYIATMLNKDNSLIKDFKKSDHKYELNKIECTAVLTLNGKLFITTVKKNSGIVCYHEYLCHPGATRTKATIRGTMTRPGLTKNVQSFCKTCKLCHLKKTRKQVAESTPWEVVQVDLVGPWNVKTPSGVKLYDTSQP
jgi:hypothetical protein